MRMKAEGIHHVDLRVTNYRRSTSFYDHILLPLGFTKEGVKGETVTYYVKGPTAIGIRPVKNRRTKNMSYSYKRAGIPHLAVSVKKRKDVDEFYQLLTKRKVKVLLPPQRYPHYSRGYYSVFFLDPDGMDLEVVHWGS